MSPSRAATCRRFLIRSVPICALLALVACGSSADSSEWPLPAAAEAADVSLDGVVQDGSAGASQDGNAGSGGMGASAGSPDADASESADAVDAAPPICDPACVQSDKYTCIKNPSTNECVPCLDDSRCAANPASLGNKCLAIAGFQNCGCQTDADCAGHPHGPSCHMGGICGCNSDASCTVGVRCATRPPTQGCRGSSVIAATTETAWRLERARGSRCPR